MYRFGKGSVFTLSVFVFFMCCLLHWFHSFPSQHPSRRLVTLGNLSKVFIRTDVPKKDTKVDQSGDTQQNLTHEHITTTENQNETDGNAELKEKGHADIGSNQGDHNEQDKDQQGKDQNQVNDFKEGKQVQNGENKEEKPVQVNKHSSKSDENTGTEKTSNLSEYAERVNQKPLNVLLLAVDDMRPEIGAFINPKTHPWLNPRIKTPNLDKLAEKSAVFHQAHVQVPCCGPSRTSILTGRRPDTTGIYENDVWFRRTSFINQNIITLPEYFKLNNYSSVGMGKVFHMSGEPMGQDQGRSWTSTFFMPRNHYDRYIEESWKAVDNDSLRFHQLRDQMVEYNAERMLRLLSSRYNQVSKPFFMAVGFKKPHLPYAFPKQFLDLYPIQEVEYPKYDFVPKGMPHFAWHNSRNMLTFNDTEKYDKEWNINSTLPRNVTLALRRGYYACISYVDNLIGKILDLLQDTGLAKETIIVFYSDHGFQLGEHGIWGKDVNLEMATNSPLIIHIPGVTDSGLHIYELTELIDIYPTLVEAARLPLVPLCPEDSPAKTPLCREGTSLMPLITNPTGQKWKDRVFSQYPHPDHGKPELMGYSMRTQQYRYTEWISFTSGPPVGTWPEPHAVELYDLDKDLWETENKAGQAEYQEVIGTLSELLHQGWRGAMPN